MQIKIKPILVLLVALAALALYLAAAPGRGPDRGGDEDPAASPAPVGAPAAPSDPEPTEGDTIAVPESIEAFLAVYGDEDLSEEKWLDQMAPHASDALLASLRGSDRALPAEAGGTILEATRDRVLVGSEGGEGVYSLALEVVQDDNGDESTVVTGIDWLAPPAGASLPLPSDALEELRAPTQDAVVAILAQPGGLTDQQRREGIEETLADPERARQTDRPAGPETAVRIGELHDLRVTADEGKVAVYALVPYAPDGSSDTQWASVTVTFVRDETGAWTPQDAWR